MPHLPFTLLLAALMAVAIAFSEQRPAGRPWRALYLFLYSMLIVIAASWTMRWIHG